MSCMDSVVKMSESRPGKSKRPRGNYSRLICLGCRERRIRCELPSDIEIPDPGELRTVQNPCYRCKKRGFPCVVRQTILGRPRHDGGSTAAVDARPLRTGDIVSRIIIELLPQPAVCTQLATVQGRDETQVVEGFVVPRPTFHPPHHTYMPPSQGQPTHYKEGGDTLLFHIPQSAETVIIIRAVDTLRREKVENEWFRHLPAHVGHSRALDLSIKALVAACAYARGVPKLTSSDCYQALSLALHAMQANIKQPHAGEELNDNILASTALLAPFEGVMKRHGVPTSLHMEGLAAVLVARSATYPVTQLAREIFDFHVCDSAVMACIQGVPSPFENVARAYYVNDRRGYSDSDQALLKSIGSELFVRIPRLVALVRSLRLETSSSLRNQLLADALRLSRSLLKLQDLDAEERLLRNIKVYPTDPDHPSPLRQALHFASVEDFEGLAYYWQNRLSLLRLERCLHDLSSPNNTQTSTNHAFSSKIPFGPQSNEILRLARNILMSLPYARELPLRKHHRLFAHAIVIVWGVMKDMPMSLDHGQDGEEAGFISDLLLLRMNHTIEAKPHLTAEDMDTAADVFVGGSLTGRFVELYGLLLTSN